MYRNLYDLDATTTPTDTAHSNCSHLKASFWSIDFHTKVKWLLSNSDPASHGMFKITHTILWAWFVSHLPVVADLNATVHMILETYTFISYCTVICIYGLEWDMQYLLQFLFLVLAYECPLSLLPLRGLLTQPSSTWILVLIFIKNNWFTTTLYTCTCVWASDTVALLITPFIYISSDKLNYCLFCPIHHNPFRWRIGKL